MDHHFYRHIAITTLTADRQGNMRGFRMDRQAGDRGTILIKNLDRNRLIYIFAYAGQIHRNSDACHPRHNGLRTYQDHFLWIKSQVSCLITNCGLAR